MLVVGSAMCVCRVAGVVFHVLCVWLLGALSVVVSCIVFARSLFNVWEVSCIVASSMLPG